MSENRRYQGVIARAGRGRHNRTCRRLFEFNLLIIGALIFVGIGIASLQSDTGQSAKLKTLERKNPHSRGDVAGAPKAVTANLIRGDGFMVRMVVLEVALPNHILVRSTTLVAAQKLFATAARPSRDANTPPSVATAGWVRTPHPLAVPLPLAGGRPTHRIVQTSYGLIATGGDFTEDPPASLVRLDTTAGKSPFWYVAASLSLATFACGFWNSRAPRQYC